MTREILNINNLARFLSIVSDSEHSFTKFNISLGYFTGIIKVAAIYRCAGAGL